MNLPTLLLSSYPILTTLFLCLRPSDLHSLCTALGIKLSSKDRGRYMNRIYEIYKDQAMSTKTILLIGDDVTKLLDRSTRKLKVHALEYSINSTISDDNSICSGLQDSVILDTPGIYKVRRSIRNIKRRTIRLTTSAHEQCIGTNDHMLSIIATSKDAVDQCTAWCDKEDSNIPMYCSIDCVLSSSGTWNYSKLSLFFCESTEVDYNIEATVCRLMALLCTDNSMSCCIAKGTVGIKYSKL